MLRKSVRIVPLAVIAAIALMAASHGATSSSRASAAGAPYTCTDGSIPAGTYSSIRVTGICSVDAGNVTVDNSVTVGPNAALFAAFGGSDLSVGGNIIAQNNSVLVLGCLPNTFPCLNDPDQEGGTLSSHPTVGGNLIAAGALAVLVHNASVDRNVVISGGGGGVTCDSQDILQGSPAYATIEDTTIGGNATIVGWRSCWLGFIRNTVSGNVVFNGNTTFDTDGNEVVTNTVNGNLICFGNSPAAQIGDSEGSPNTVGRQALGQCATLAGSGT